MQEIRVQEDRMILHESSIQKIIKYVYNDNRKMDACEVMMHIFSLVVYVALIIIFIVLPRSRDEFIHFECFGTTTYGNNCTFQYELFNLSGIELRYIYQNSEIYCFQNIICFSEFHEMPILPNKTCRYDKRFNKCSFLDNSIKYIDESNDVYFVVNFFRISLTIIISCHIMIILFYIFQNRIKNYIESLNDIEKCKQS